MNDSEGSNPAVSSDLFAATHWSVVLRARDKSEQALAVLCANYRQPLLLWLRSRAGNPQDAEDLVQDFFAHLLKRDFLGNVSPAKGRFRTFLLVSLKNFLRDDHDRKTAAKRGGGRPVQSLHETTEDGRLCHDQPTLEESPDVEFDRNWADAVLASALRNLEAECARSGHQALCAALEPTLFADETAASYREIGERLGMTEGAVKVAAHRLRNRLRNLIRAEVRQTVADEQALEQELRHLIALFGR